MNQDLKWILLDAFENGSNYEICNQFPFNIRNIKTQRIIKGCKDKKYIRFSFWENNKCKHYMHHVIIYKTFVHFYTNPKLHIDHINGICDDNRIENLKLCTASENNKNTHFYKGFERQTFYDEENMIHVQDDIFYHKQHDVFCRKCNDGYKLKKEYLTGKSFRISYRINYKFKNINTTRWREVHYYLY